MEKTIYDYYLNIFGSYIRLPSCNETKDDYVVPNVLPCEIRHAISSVANRTAPAPQRIRPEHLKILPPVLIKTLARLFTRHPFELKVLKVSREYKKPLCLVFIGLRKAFDSIETEAVTEELTNQALPAPYIEILCNYQNHLVL
ncbi:hypothetical protein DICVIV_05144 [Dictyocaulus viviparus]|uniref:Reverse transcriptase domain-containing protein n=1 Tax=Dictyocaulus viviparus TaxID=29172 RepID=A0A0D8XW84_DICVI|nr:hypothetical protein DICVIV_05144 [Dictyocaulus viviparus]